MDIKSFFKYLLCLAVGFIFGFMTCYIFYPRIVTVTKDDKKITGEAKTTTNTQISYVSKGTVTNADGTTSREKTDLDITIPKQELNVKINGKDAVISKTDDEQYLFEKNKVSLQQSSKAEISINVPVQDKTKYWAIGIGYGKNGVAGAVDFPISKKHAIGGWVYADKATATGGMKIHF